MLTKIVHKVQRCKMELIDKLAETRFGLSRIEAKEYCDFIKPMNKSSKNDLNMGIRLRRNGLLSKGNSQPKIDL